MRERNESEPQWRPWKVVPESGFEVSGADAFVGLNQVSTTEFEVSGEFRFTNEDVEAFLVEKLSSQAHISDCQAKKMAANASSFGPSSDRTDLASIPPFMQWFERPYGSHTLAGLMHDRLITETPNGGMLRSDTLSDTFFRKMLGACKVPFIKRWVMWGAVALRSRWAAGGWRRATLLLWAFIAAVGLSLFGAGVVWTIAVDEIPAESWYLQLVAVVLISLSSLLRQKRKWMSVVVAATGVFVFAAGALLTIAAGAVPVGAWILILAAVLLPFVAAPLWGKQWGASVVAAVAGLFVIPAAAFVVLGLGIYSLLEDIADYAGWS